MFSETQIQKLLFLADNEVSVETLDMYTSLIDELEGRLDSKGIVKYINFINNHRDMFTPKGILFALREAKF